MRNTLLRFNLTRTLIVAALFFVVYPILLCQQALTNDSIIKSTHMGFSEELIVSKIYSAQGAFDTSSDGIAALKSAGVSPKVISAMISRSSALATPEGPTPAPVSLGANAHPLAAATLASPSPAPVAVAAAPQGKADAPSRRPLYTYQDGILQSFHIEKTGKSCSNDAITNGTINAKTDGNGATNGTVSATTTGTTTCHDTQRAIYTVRTAENVLVLTPALSGKGEATALMTLGWSRVFAKNSVLAYQLPGATLQIRGDGKHYFIKIRDRESIYTVLGAE